MRYCLVALRDASSRHWLGLAHITRSVQPLVRVGQTAPEWQVAQRAFEYLLSARGRRGIEAPTGGDGASDAQLVLLQRRQLRRTKSSVRW